MLRVRRILLAFAKKLGIYFNRFVFDGQGTEPWKPDCKEYAPLNIYGQSKLNGELAVSEILDNILLSG